MSGARVGPAALVALGLVAACAPAERPGTPAASTLVIGIDVSGSFRDAGLYDDAVNFAATYIFAHLHGLDGLRTPSALFVGSVGGARPGEPKPFHPINDFTGRTVEQIAAQIRTWFPPTDLYTDFNAFFERVSGLVKERGLILAPLSVIVFSDGVPDVTPGSQPLRGDARYTQISLRPLEFLSRSVTDVALVAVGAEPA